jgi:pteridine reductase
MVQPKVALVTGSGKKRVGWHVAARLVQCGYAVIVHYHTSAREAAETVKVFQQFAVHGLDSVVAMQADLTDETAVQGLFQETLSRFGRLDVFVHCAGLWKSHRLEEIRAADVRQHFEINVLSTFLCAREAGLAMVRQRQGGCIITLGDWAEARPYPNYAAYFASKGALPTLTRSLAVELGTRNPRVRVNCILPGPVMLPPDLPVEERREAIAATLVGHEGSPNNVAAAVLCLIDNDFITGASLPVDGGRTIYAGGT